MNKNQFDGSNLPLDANWMRFTATRQFKQNLKMLVSAKGMHYHSDDGRQIFDALLAFGVAMLGIVMKRLPQRFQTSYPL